MCVVVIVSDCATDSSAQLLLLQTVVPQAAWAAAGPTLQALCKERADGINKAALAEWARATLQQQSQTQIETQTPTIARTPVLGTGIGHGGITHVLVGQTNPEVGCASLLSLPARVGKVKSPQTPHDPTESAGRCSGRVGAMGI